MLELGFTIVQLLEGYGHFAVYLEVLSENVIARRGLDFREIRTMPKLFDAVSLQVVAVATASGEGYSLHEFFQSDVLYAKFHIEAVKVYWYSSKQTKSVLSFKHFQQASFVVVESIHYCKPMGITTKKQLKPNAILKQVYMVFYANEHSTKSISDKQ